MSMMKIFNSFALSGFVGTSPSLSFLPLFPEGRGRAA
jgi:hypothetical protein